MMRELGVAAKHGTRKTSLYKLPVLWQQTLTLNPSFSGSMFMLGQGKAACPVAVLMLVDQFVHDPKYITV